MVDLLNDDFMVCSDCLMAIANDDYSALDYYHSPEVAARRKQEIEAGIAAVADEGGYIAVGDSDRDEAFSRAGCDCCGSGLAGALHHCVVLGRE